MQPPQGYDPQDPYSGGQWARVPTPGQPQGQGGYAYPGQVPPPADLGPGPAPEPGPIFQEAPPSGGGQPPQNGYQVPKTGVRAVRQKQGRGVYVALTLIALAFAAFAAARLMQPQGPSYGYVRYGSRTSLYTGDAVVVRNETVVSQENVSQIAFDVEEGAFLESSKNVATVYTAGFNTKEWTTLNNYRSLIKEYHKVLIENAASDTVMMNNQSQVQARAMEVQKLVHGAKGSVITQEKLLLEAMETQQAYIKKINSDDPKLIRLYDDEKDQLQRISTWTKQFVSIDAGYISFYTDGYEKKLNMTTFADFTPAQARDMYNGNAPAVETVLGQRPATDIYRLVRPKQWALLMLCSEKDWTPQDGQVYNLVIESYDDHPLTATVYSSTRSGGELLVRLLVDDTSFLKQALYLRSCQVRLGENASSLMVPSQAIYVQNGRKGVVIRTEGGEFWTGVEVIEEQGGVSYVKPDQPGVLYDGMPVRLF